MVRGEDDVDDLPRRSRLSTRAAFEEAVLVALRRPPCVVSFSGGRDSSAVLAVAADLARREGLPLPIPVSLRFPRSTDSDERFWQETVVASLNLHDWVIVELSDEIDLIGPIAARVISQLGVVWPMNAHFHLPIMELARGGAVLTGFGGDELLDSGWRWQRLNDVVARRRRPAPRDLVSLPLASTAWGRRILVHRRMQSARDTREWLRPSAQAELGALLARDMTALPLRWGDSVTGRWWRSRYRRVGGDTLSFVGRVAGVEAVVHPFLAPRFLTAIAAEHPWGFATRTEAMSLLFSDVLDSAVTSRESKAAFLGVFYGKSARGYAATWAGDGVDPSVVDPERLRQMWLSESPDGRSLALLQASWWECEGRSAME
jgi:hypothetical protein